ncbi:MAG TPA: TfuA-like protein, partial [Candidatus Baltobacteraceae bacterium]
MSVYVFLGPSLDRARAKSLLDAHYLPPVKMGDVSALLQEKPKAIGIIDGYFEYTPAVWHKEVLFALASGVRVFGGGSMGALRAAELHPFGMEGIGQTFDAYAGGTLEDDDEVAVAHGRAEDGFLTLSDAMVNLRHGLALAVEAKCIVPSTKSKLEEVAKALFYPERSWGALYSAAPSLGVERHEIEALRNFVDEVKPDIKRDDAELVLRTMAARLTNDVPA